MAVVKANRDPEAIEPLLLYALLSEPVEGVGGLSDDSRLSEFLERVKKSIQVSLNTESRMHGFRTQSLFRAVMVGLGGFRLLKDEDVGEIYYEESSGEIRPPDYRVVDNDGNDLLIEVKNSPPSRPRGPLKLRSSDFLSTLRYSEVVGVPVSVAVYWSPWNIWTLVDSRHFEKRNGHFVLDMGTALKRNQLSRFGDAMIGTKPPLIVRLFVEQIGESSESPGGFAATIKTVGFEIESGGIIVEASEEAQIAFSLFMHGNWAAVDENVIQSADGRIESIEISVRPPGPEDEIEEQGFALVGSLSSMISSFYNGKTLAEDGSIQELRQAVDPGVWSSLVPDSFWDDPDRQLSLWKLTVVPNED